LQFVTNLAGQAALLGHLNEHVGDHLGLLRLDALQVGNCMATKPSEEK
jgi:hypothetical protein